MGYTDEELDNGYGDDLGQNKADIPVWNSSSVYFDDEIVEYQGRYYLALCKTSAKVPGRSKPGIWKEIVYTEDESPMRTDESDIYDEPLAGTVVKINKNKKDASSSAPKAKAAQQASVSAKTKETNEKAPVTKKAAEPSTKPVNKPLMKKQTLKERAQAKKTASKTVKPTEAKEMDIPMIRKMKVAPSEQNLVNTILKEMEFKKIKGFNVDDSNICKNLILPQTKDGAKLEWNSSHLDIISSKGEVHRPTDGHDVAVNLSLTVRLNKTSATRFYTLWVKAEEKVLSDEECVDLVYEELTFLHIKGSNEKESAITHDLELLTHGLYDTEIFWASSDREMLDERGHLNKNNLAENTKLRIYAIIAKNGVERLKHFDLILKV